MKPSHHGARIASAAILVLFLAVLSCSDSPSPISTPTTGNGSVNLSAAQITLTQITTGFNGPIGIDHHQPTNKVVMSVNYPTGMPHNFELVAADGSRTQFSAISGFTDEIKIATARTNLGGFTPGELFTGTGVPGVIARTAFDGSSVQNPWVTLPGEPGLMRGSLYVDRTGVYGGDLIVVTTAGNVWRVTSAGVATQLASIGTHLEGLTTVPNDATKYGPWAGKILVGAEAQTRIYTIDALGNVAFYSLGIQPEDIEIIPANQNFFGIDFGGATLWGAGPAEFASMVGDFLIAQEFPGYLWHVKWNGSSFDTEVVAQVPQWEHVTFSTAGIKEVPPVGPTLDIHPTSCPNPFNMVGLLHGKGNGGVMPVAIVGNEGFDVSTIDVSTVRLEGVAPIRHAYADVSTPAEGEEDCPCTTAGADGIRDLTLKFHRADFAAMFETLERGEIVTLTLTGKLTDGTNFSASDCVIIKTIGAKIEDSIGQ